MTLTSWRTWSAQAHGLTIWYWQKGSFDAMIARVKCDRNPSISSYCCSFAFSFPLWMISMEKKARTAQLVNDSLPCWEAQHLSAMLNELHGSLAIFSTRVAILGHFPLQRQPLFVYVIAWPRLFVNKSRSVLSLPKKLLPMLENNNDND